MLDDLVQPSQVGLSFPCVRSFVVSVTLRNIMSLGLNLLSLTLCLWYFIIFFLCFVILHRASSLTSSKQSRSSLQLLSLVLLLKGSLLRLDWLTSTRMTTYVPKASLNGVSPIGVLAIIQYAHNTPRCFFGHAPSSRTLMIFSKVRFVTFVYPLAWGCLGEKKWFLIPRLWQKYLNLELSNCRPLFEMIILEILNL